MTDNRNEYEKGEESSDDSTDEELVGEDISKDWDLKDDDLGKDGDLSKEEYFEESSEEDSFSDEETVSLRLSSFHPMNLPQPFPMENSGNSLVGNSLSSLSSLPSLPSVGLPTSFVYSMSDHFNMPPKRYVLAPVDEDLPLVPAEEAAALFIDFDVHFGPFEKTFCGISNGLGALGVQKHNFYLVMANVEDYEDESGDGSSYSGVFGYTSYTLQSTEIELNEGLVVLEPDTFLINDIKLTHKILTSETGPGELEKESVKEFEFTEKPLDWTKFDNVVAFGDYWALLKIPII